MRDHCHETSPVLKDHTFLAEESIQWPPLLDMLKDPLNKKILAASMVNACDTSGQIYFAQGVSLLEVDSCTSVYIGGGGGSSVLKYNWTVTKQHLQPETTIFIDNRVVFQDRFYSITPKTTQQT